MVCFCGTLVVHALPFADNTFGAMAKPSRSPHSSFSVGGVSELSTNDTPAQNLMEPTRRVGRACSRILPYGPSSEKRIVRTPLATPLPQP